MGTQPFVLGKDRQSDLFFWLPLDGPHDKHMKKKGDA